MSLTCKTLDESGCCLWSAVSYSYYFKGEQKRQEQTKKRGKRLSVLGLWQPLVKFICSFVLGRQDSEDFILPDGATSPSCW
ncbi:MAG: hypothetical protein F6K65_15250 [Moorea sp. SIO3C2]|uniref:Uncharacterized protein n=1 Tax=Moorena producens (strain JHB) TaxID=1454205 RepID=A0A9Q9SUZ0_MOOP1|nr:hypothetical protein [Moorena producens]NEP50098.1 hypothetical protein [Moorena sp. SIO3C2]WAN70120.1 hypothetical protein BJP36_39390 [Moorena producens JHB]